MTRITDILAARMERIRRAEKADAGFTLIELLVVVIIIGILAAIAIPVFLNQRQSAWKASVQTDVHNATLAVEAFSAQNSGSTSSLSPTSQIYCGGSSTGCVETTGNDLTIRVSSGNKVTVATAGSGSSATYTVVATNSNLTGAQSVYTYTSNTGKGVWSAT